MIDPKTVEPGFLKRWGIQALDLVVRSPILWGLMVCLFMGMSMVLRHPMYDFLMGGIFLHVFTNLMATTDTHKISVQNFVASVKAGAYSFYQSFNYSRAYVLGFLIIMFVINMYFRFFSTPTEVKESSSYWVQFAFTVFFGYVFLCGGGKFKIFMPFLLRKNTDSSPAAMDAMLATCESGALKNYAVSSFFETKFYFTCLILALLIPHFFIVLALVIPAFTYVAYREIFEDIDKNQKQTKEVKVEKTAFNFG